MKVTKKSSGLVVALIGALAMFGTNAVYAAGIANNLYVEAVRVDKSGKGFVQFASPLEDARPTCAEPQPKTLAFDANTPGGQAILSIALAAQAGGKQIYAKGTGDCSVYGTVESWLSGWVKN